MAGNGIELLNGRTVPTNPKVLNVIENLSDYWALIRKDYSVPGYLYRLMCCISAVHTSRRRKAMAYLPRRLINP